jgi:hypothetical protein
MGRTSASRIAAVAAAVLLAPLAGAGSADAAGLTWTISQSAAGSSPSQLVSVACTSPTSCFATGSQGSSNTAQPLVESWDGVTWRLATTAPLSGATSSVLVGVSCPSASFCVAAGTETFSSSPEQALVETWNGAAWSVAPIPEPTGMSALSSLSCPSVSFCMAMGGGDIGPLVEVWNGTSWSLDPGPNAVAGASLGGLACASSSACYAVGYVPANSGGDLTVVEAWNGSTWSSLPSASPSPNSFLLGATCVATTSCTAVGYYGTAAGDSVTLVESFNGTSWTQVASPSPSGPDAGLNAVACVTASSCVAVGRYFVTGANYQTLVEAWDGNAWTVVPSPNAAFTNILQGVACTSAAWCTAVGFDAPSTGGNVPLTEVGTSATRTSTSLSSSANPAVVGQTVTYRATVTPAPDGGTVSFTDGGAAISGCTAVALSATGVATCSASYPSSGTHSVAASYSGTATFNASGGSLSETVNPAATSVGVVGSAPIVVGQSVTFTATVAVTAPGAATPAGSVSFSADGVGLAGCAGLPVQQGQAACTTGGLTAGAHTVTAQYSGDGATAASSGSTTQQVGYAMALLYNAGTAVRAGSSYTFKVELQDASGADLSQQSITVTALCVVLQPATTCASPLRTLNQAFSFASSRKTAASYSFTLSTKGLASGSYDLVVAVAGDPTRHTAPFRLS